MSWEENRRVGPPVDECKIMCSGVGARFREVTNSSAWKWIGVGLGVLAMFGCAVCGLVSVGMSVLATAGNCTALIAGEDTGMDCASGVASLALGGAAGVSGKIADDLAITGANLTARGARIRGAVATGVSYLPRSHSLVASSGSLAIDTADAGGVLPKSLVGTDSDCEVNLRC